MLRSLRFRLPALFFFGIVVSGVIAAAIALRLFQGYVQSRLKAELRRDAVGFTDLYREQAIKENGAAPRFAAAKLEKATGAKLYFIGLSPFPGKKQPLRILSANYLPNWQSDKQITFEFTPPGSHHRYVAVANPLRLPAGKNKGQQFGDVIVAKPKTELVHRLLTLVDRLAIAFVGGIVIAGLLGWYLSRRRAHVSIASSGTSSISRAWRRIASRCSTKRSTWSASATRRTSHSERKRAAAASTTAVASKRARRSCRTATECCRSSPIYLRTRFAGRLTAAASASS